MTCVYDFEAATIDGRTVRLDDYRGQALLVVNVASQCGFTPQYAELESLYRKHRATGFAILGFPCDQFGHQEPGSEADIKSFCTLNYDVTFPLFAKIKVNGPSAHPLYRYLKSARRGFLGTKSVKWNFTKFLINRHGQPVRRFFPTAATDRIENALVPLLSIESLARAECTRAR
ncbi:MAG TPA: glutathione peroxidase [Pirellulales bacterium]|jgi:glutathione peroxidase|nr:glutathione peroxidase [Pirellulales bacterium]